MLNAVKHLGFGDAPVQENEIPRLRLQKDTKLVRSGTRFQIVKDSLE
jgi:hypothetical protein